MQVDFAERFKRYLAEDGESPKTIESYVGDIAGFIKYLKSMGVSFESEMRRFYVTRIYNKWYRICNQLYL